MAQFKPYVTTNNKIEDTTNLPIKEGQFIVTTDDGKIYLDTSSKRVLVGNSKDTTYTASDGVNINGTKITNSGVRSISTGASNGTISVNKNGTSSNVAVKGLGSAAYTASTDYAAASHTHSYAGSSSAGGAANSVAKSITFNNSGSGADSGASYNGSSSPTISYNTIGAASSGHNHDSTYLKLSGGTVSGALTVTGKTTATGKITIPTSPSSWLSGKTTSNAAIQISTQQSTSSYSPILATTTSSGHVLNFGGLGNNVGFYGYLSSRTENGTDWSFVVDTTSGNWTCNKSITADKGFIGSLIGNASTATTLQSTTAVGSSTQPIYFNGGKPVAITGSIANSTTGSAAKLTTARKITLSGAVTGNTTFDGSGDTTISTTLSNFDASKITSGTINIARLPHGALERLKVVANEAARFALTTSDVQNGDTVKQTDTGVMYYVVDDSKLSQAAGYEIYTAGRATVVPWSGVENKPTSIKLTGSVTGNVSLGSGELTLATTTNHSHNYAGSSSAGGVANSAAKLSNTSAIGSETLPVYFNASGVPVAINTTGVKISITGSSGSCTGNAATATQATQDSAGQQINTTYIKGLRVSGRVITYTKGDGATGTITTQDTIYTALKNPYAITIQGNGTTLTNGIYDGSAPKTVNITPTSIGAAASSHTHSYLPLSGGTLTGTLTANAPIAVNKYLSLAFVNGSYLTGMDNTQVKINTSGSGIAGYCPLIGVKTQNNHYFNLGGKGDQYGFFSFKSGRTTDGYDARFVLDASTNKFYLKGNMEMEGFFKISNEIQCTSQAAYRSVNGNYGAYWFNNGSDFYLVMTDSGNQYGGFNSYRPFYVNFSTGIASLNGAPGGVNCGTSATPTGNPGTIYIQY